MASGETSSSERPTRARLVVLAFLCSMAFVLYLDRVCISQALVPMKAEFGLNNDQTKYILMAFTLAYGIFELPTGRLGDQLGSRRVLTRIVLWWSAFTTLTGCIVDFSYEFLLGPVPIVLNSLLLLVMIRFWFGAGEAGAIPNAARILKMWFPLAERGRMQGLFQASMHVGGMLAPIVAAEIIESITWRWTFYLFGIVGVVWAAVFYWWFRDTPEEHPNTNEAERRHIHPVPLTDDGGHHAIPWHAAARHPNLWLLGFICSMTSFNSYLFFSWYPTYLREGRSLTNREAGLLAALVLAGMTVGAIVGGVVADRITRFSANRYRTRRIVAIVVFALAAMALSASVNTDIAILSALLCALAGFLMFIQQSTWWACTFEASGKHTGALFGLLNGVGIFGAMGSQYFFGTFSHWRSEQGYIGRDQWDPAFYVCAVGLICAGLLWQLVRDLPAVDEGPSQAQR